MTMMKLILLYLTYEVDTVWQGSGSQWSRILGQALIKQEDYGAVPASLKGKNKHHCAYHSVVGEGSLIVKAKTSLKV